MRLARYLLVAIGATILLAALILVGFTYRSVQTDTYDHLYRESEAIYNFLMSVRRVYQKQFLESGIELNEKTVGFLPAHSLPRISREFSDHWDQRGIQIRTSSDRSRNPDNRADRGELAAMAWFLEDDSRKVYTKDEGERFLYVRPIWVVKSCLKCHGKAEDAPPSIRARYADAFGYEVGDLRGVVSIRIPTQQLGDEVMRGFAPHLVVLLIAFLLMGTAVYFAVRRLLQQPLQQMADGVQSISEQGDQSLRLSSQRGELGEFVVQFNGMMDEQQQLHLALTEQKEKMEQILQSMAEGVVVTDTEGRIIHINQRLEQWSGWPSITHFGEPVERLFDRDERLSLPQPGEERRCLLNHHSGEPIPVLVSVSALNPQQGASWRVEGEVFVMHDLRERTRAEQQEEYASFQAGIAEMATMILHNVGNALTALDGGVLRLKNQMEVIAQLEQLFYRSVEKIDQLKQDHALNEEAQEQLEGIRTIVDQGTSQILTPLLAEMRTDGVEPLELSLRHMTEIIRAQQRSAKLAPHLSRFHLEEVLKDTLIMQQDQLDKIRIKVIEQINEPLSAVTLPKNQMIQALNNLIKNSYESIAERMQQEPTLEGELTLSLAQEGELTIIQVADNGIGVAKEELEKIFGFGYTSKPRGSGFGLHATANFIRGLGGDVILQSDGVGMGATVEIRVPNQEGNEIAV